MKQEIEKKYLASLGDRPKPVGIDEEKMKAAYGTVPFVVGKLETGHPKAVLLWRVV